VALLRASSTALGTYVEPGPALDDGVGIPTGRLLLDFATAAHRGDPDLPAARRALLAAVGPAGLLEACLTVGVFNGLTRVADATGIPLDGGTLAATTDVRAELALNDMAGARSSGEAIHTGGPALLPATVRELFAE
jgi:hypothetical protein